MSKLLLISASLILAFPLWANEKNKTDQKESQNESSSELEFMKNWSYPELQVVPRATKRLQMEARAEKGGFWYVHWTYQVSALSTLMAASSAPSNYNPGLTPLEKKAADDEVAGVQLLSGAWLIGMTYLSFTKPYASGLSRVARFRGKDKAGQLARERMAEEELSRSAELITTLKYLSVGTNLIGSAALSARVEGNGRVLAIVGIAMSFLPLVFEHPYVYNDRMQKEYKKKIYAPLSSLRVHPGFLVGQNSTAFPSLQMSLQF